MSAGDKINYYEEELLQLDATYELAAAQNVESLCTAIEAASESSIIGVGSGGSYTVASMLCNLHETYTGRVSRPATPLELICNPGLASASPIFLISAEGKNPDIVEALMRVRYQTARAIHVITNRADSVLMSKALELSEITSHVYSLEHKDGYLATNSLLLDAVVIARAYGKLDQASELPDTLSKLRIGEASPIEWIADATRFITEVVSRRNIIVVYSPSLRPIAYDLESKLSEAALLHCQLADIRSFAHGRHLWLAQRQSDCALLVLLEPSMAKLWGNMSAVLPTEIPIQELLLDGAGPKELITGLVTQMHLVARLAHMQGFDAGRPDVPIFGREIYYLKMDEQIERPKKANDFGEKSKFEVLGTRWPSIIQSGTMKRARDSYLAEIQKQHFRAIVLDYDGTLCASSRRSEPPTDVIVQCLQRLIAAEIVVGIASGRGGSIAEALRKVLPQEIFGKIKLGLYNAGQIFNLSDEHTEVSGKRSDFLSHVTRIVNGLKALGIPITGVHSSHPHQVSVRFREGVSTEQMWFVFGDALHSAGLDISRMVRSRHSIDILAPGVSKSKLIAALVQEHGFGPYEILTIGDNGAWPGNDFALLEHRYSLSVEFPSRRLDRGWKFAPDHKRNVDATIWYLERLHTSGGTFKISLGESLNQLGTPTNE
jgi:fructoselysine-6-P-deglycase FrlB-like protein